MYFNLFFMVVDSCAFPNVIMRIYITCQTNTQVTHAGDDADNKHGSGPSESSSSSHCDDDLPKSDDEIKSLFAEESEKENEEVEPAIPEFQIPWICTLDDGRSILNCGFTGKKLVLPDNERWTLRKVSHDGTDDYLLVCLSNDRIQKRYVHQALASRRAIGLNDDVPTIENKDKTQENAKEPQDSQVESKGDVKDKAKVTGATSAETPPSMDKDIGKATPAETEKVEKTEPEKVETEVKEKKSKDGNDNKEEAVETKNVKATSKPNDAKKDTEKASSSSQTRVIGKTPAAATKSATGNKIVNE